MQNGTITYYLPYNILSSSNLAVNVCIVEYKFNPGRIQWVAQGARRTPPPLNFQSGNFLTIIAYTINPPVSDMLVPAPPHLNVYPFPFKGWCLGCIIYAINRLKTHIRQ